MDAFIYCLIDPITSEVRYVGKASNVKKRFHRHLSEKRGTHKNNWIYSLESKGLKPSILVVQSLYDCTDEQWQNAEIFWINHYRNEGCNLCNLDAGGKSGFLKSEETKKRMSLAQKGRVASDESRQKMRLAKLGKKQSPEAIEAAHAPLRGLKRSDEVRRKMSEAKRAGWARHKALGLVRPMSEDTRSLHRKNATGRKHTEQAKAKMRASIAAKKALQAVKA